MKKIYSVGIRASGEERTGNHYLYEKKYTQLEYTLSKIYSKHINQVYMFLNALALLFIVTYIYNSINICDDLSFRGPYSEFVNFFNYCIYVSEILHTNRKRNSKSYLFLTIFRFDA